MAMKFAALLKTSALSLAFAILAAACFSWTIVLQGRDQPPAYVLPVWALSLLSTVLAFPPRNEARSAAPSPGRARSLLFGGPAAPTGRRAPSPARATDAFPSSR